MLVRYILVFVALLTIIGKRKVVCANDVVVAAYLPEYRSYINVNNTAAHLTDLIVFSLAPDGQGNLGPCCLEPHHFAQAREARAFKSENYPDAQPLKLWMSIGGAGRSNAFRKVASDAKLRKQFVLAIKKKVQEEQFDGVDLDWEAPQTRDDYLSYMKLVQKLYKELDGILLSVALHPKQIFPSTFYAHVSRINLMTYDMVDGSGGHHSSMESSKAAIYQLTNSGCPKNQIVLGIPAYARHGRNPGEVKTYSEIVDMQLEMDPNVDFSTVEQRSSLKGFLFDSPKDVNEKVEYAVNDGLAGVFFWELGQDKQHEEWAPGGILLEAAAQQAKGYTESKSSKDNTKSEL